MAWTFDDAQIHKQSVIGGKTSLCVGKTDIEKVLGTQYIENGLHVGEPDKFGYMQGTVMINKSAAQIGLFALEVKDHAHISDNLLVEGITTCPIFVGNLQGNATSAKVLGGAFDIPNLKRPGWRIRHVIPEGPEAGIYVRGRIKGHNKIYLPEYWQGLVDTDTITVTLTQIGSSQDLIIESIDWGRVVNLKSGNGCEIDCFYEAWAARHLDPLNPDEKLHVEYEGKSPDDYPGDKSRFLVGGWDYDRRDPVTGERVQS